MQHATGLPRAVLSSLIAPVSKGVARYDPIAHYDMPRTFLDIFLQTRAYTKTTIERMRTLYDSVCYIHNAGIAGSIVECGVWRGGSIMVALMTLLKLNCNDRQVYLYDTFNGMSAPTDVDIDWRGKPASEMATRCGVADFSDVCNVPIDAVRAAVQQTQYPMGNVHFVKGKVEDTIPGTLPGKIALLRLDTDFYESTKHELIHLYPLLAKRGVLIVDDYGHFKGVKQAVHEYMAELGQTWLLQRIDCTGRLIIKQE